MTDPTADTSAIEAAHTRFDTDGVCLGCGDRFPCRGFFEQYVDKLETQHDQLLADNARLTVRIEDLERELYGIGDER